MRGNKVTVVGLARSGTGAANLLSEMGASVTVTDIKPEEALKDHLSGLSGEVRTVLGGHPDELFMSADMIVVSPGVPEIRQIKEARAAGVPVIGELELAYQILTTAGPGAVPFMAITGSNGKSTTTTLSDLMLRKNGSRTLLGGNIGNSLTEEIYKRCKTAQVSPASVSAMFDWVVAEVSSFQLETVSTFRPRIAALLNVTPDHMDRYHSLREYGSVKARIAGNQGPEDFLVLNADDPVTMEILEELPVDRGEGPQVYFFSRKKEVNGVFLRDGDVWCSLPVSSDGAAFRLISAGSIGIKGVHNLENAMAASAMALLAGCSARAVTAALAEFSGLEHRLEPVRELDGVRYFNDSKGTNVDAVLKSLESFSEPVVLIAGGRDKAGDFEALRGPVSRKVKAVVLIGEASHKIKKALDGATDVFLAGGLGEAVTLARGVAKAGDVVLLSPACASFDMFRDFEDRGRQFKKLVMELRP
ncbi:MAG: UDP-N-acetylmuramoyl-L-alanine--D-glutamate ligase [Nitrospirae bacterium]|nr:UDP-N-acetylmuramoyl-L-alanine--D-glutamate ligase [Nitrospirota bacterium]